MADNEFFIKKNYPYFLMTENVIFFLYISFDLYYYGIEINLKTGVSNLKNCLKIDFKPRVFLL